MIKKWPNEKTIDKVALSLNRESEWVGAALMESFDSGAHSQNGTSQALAALRHTQTCAVFFPQESISPFRQRDLCWRQRNEAEKVNKKYSSPSASSLARDFREICNVGKIARLRRRCRVESECTLLGEAALKGCRVASLYSLAPCGASKARVDPPRGGGLILVSPSNFVI